MEEELATLERETRSSITRFQPWTDHPNYKHGKDSRWKKEQILTKFPICQRCQMRHSVLVHHRDRDRYHNEDINLMALCKSCHEIIHESDPHKPYPGPTAATIAKWKGRRPWNKGLKASDNPSIKGGRKRRANCPYGHPFDLTNTYITKKGWQSCRACMREAQHRYAIRRKASNG